jgi:hypothetical protein
MMDGLLRRLWNPVQAGRNLLSKNYRFSASQAGMDGGAGKRVISTDLDLPDIFFRHSVDIISRKCGPFNNNEVCFLIY